MLGESTSYTSFYFFQKKKTSFSPLATQKELKIRYDINGFRYVWIKGNNVNYSPFKRQKSQLSRKTFKMKTEVVGTLSHQNIILDKKILFTFKKEN